MFQNFCNKNIKEVFVFCSLIKFQTDSLLFDTFAPKNRKLAETSVILEVIWFYPKRYSGEILCFNER